MKATKLDARHLINHFYIYALYYKLIKIPR